MIISVSSSNSNFSHVIGKHPDSICLKKIRQGYGVGWWNARTYNIRFLDNPDEISYPKYVGEKYDYLSLAKYNSALCVLNLITEFLRPKPEHDIRKYNNITFVCSLSKRVKKLIQKYISGVTIYSVPYSTNNYNISVDLYCKFSEFLAHVEVLLWLIVLDNNENVFIGDELVQKIIKKMRLISSPYFLRYIIKCRLIRRDQWEKFKPLISFAGEELTFGSNMESRINFVKNRLTGNAIVDVGCGEGNYFFLSKDRPYYGIENNEERFDRAKKKAENYPNVMLFSSVEEFLSYYQNSSLSESNIVDVLMTGVIEHIPDLDSFLKDIQKINANRWIITTPNKTFNIYYMLGDHEYRHEEHCKEWNFLGIYEYLKSFGSVISYNVGDVINMNPTTIGLVVCPAMNTVYR